MSNQMSSFIARFLKPFWFSDTCDKVKVPYVYGTFIIGLFIASVVIFLVMAASKEYEAGVLGVVSSVIATLAGLYFGIIKLYNTGKVMVKPDCVPGGRQESDK